MNDLEKYFRNNNDRLIHKWHHYFEVYDRHFSRFRDKDIVILEIGVSHGGSLQMWREYFGKKVRIYGVDVNPDCKALEEENIQIFIGSQSNRQFLREIKKVIPPIDILIDDGGHTMIQQIVTYQELFHHVKSDGVYLCEDLHTSYWVEYGGGYKRRNTFIEFSKNFIDYLHAFHSKQKLLEVNDFTRTVDSVHYYDSIIVVEKRAREKPYHEKSGHLITPDRLAKKNPKTRRIAATGRKILRTANVILRFFKLPGFVIR